MTIQESLNKARETEANLTSLAEQRRHLLEVADSIGISPEDLNDIDKADKTGSVASKLADIEIYLEDKATEYRQHLMMISGIIAMVENEKWRQILELRYLCGKEWKEILPLTNYSNLRSLMRAHAAAIRALKKVYDD